MTSPVNLALCKSEIWPLIVSSLESLRAQPNTSRLVDCLRRIVTVVWTAGYVNEDVINRKLHGMPAMIDHLPPGVKQRFFGVTLPAMIQDIITTLPAHLTSLPYLQRGISDCISLTPQECYMLLAASFFCIPLYREDKCLMRETTFIEFFEKSRSCQANKLRCVIEYFNNRSFDGTRTLKITRIVAPEENSFGSQFWSSRSEILTDFHVHGDSERIEDSSELVQADFANRYLGGGVLGRGCVQEEIRFVISPELIVACFLCDPMTDTEAISITGSKQFTKYSGYSDSFTCTGLIEGDVPVDACVVAIDALPFGHQSTEHQFKPECILRELEKCRIGLTCEPSDIGFATGNWGCGVFGGDAQLKAMIQWMAATVAGREIHYFPFGDRRISSLSEIVQTAKSRRWTVGQLFEAILEAPTGESQCFDFLVKYLH